MLHLICQEWDTIDILEEHTLWPWTIVMSSWGSGFALVEKLLITWRMNWEVVWKNPQPRGQRVEQQIMIALRFYGSGAQLQVVGDTLGFDKSTISRVVDSVTDALVARKDQHIKWPMEIHRLNTIKEGFYKKAHFPNVIGCVAGTHVRIQGPTEDEPSYVNRKGYHSINVQGICDDNGMYCN